MRLLIKWNIFLHSYINYLSAKMHFYLNIWTMYRRGHECKYNITHIYNPTEDKHVAWEEGHVWALSSKCSDWQQPFWHSVHLLLSRDREFQWECNGPNANCLNICNYLSIMFRVISITTDPLIIKSYKYM